MSTSKNTDQSKSDKLIPAPSWCAAMATIIDFQIIAEENGKNFSEALREAIDKKIKRIKNG